MEPNDEIKKITRIIKTQTEALKRIGLFTLKDLLFYFPNRYQDTGSCKSIIELNDGEKSIIQGKIDNIKKEVSFKSRIPMTKAKLSDTTGSIELIWLHQPYMTNIIKPGQTITLTGTINVKNGKKSIMNPDVIKGDIEIGNSLFNNTDIELSTIPVYPETRGLNSKWFYYTIQKIISAGIHKKIKDPLPEYILEKYHLPKLDSALLWMHIPRNDNDRIAALKRFAFEEILYIEIERLRARAEYQSNGAYSVNPEVKDFIKSLPFDLTNGQKNVLKDILDDCIKKIPMTRLLEGDVGSGKTAIAAAISYATINSTSPIKKNEGLQVLYMAPTEILANQHFESFTKMFTKYGKTIGLLTSSGCKKFPAKSVSTKRQDIEWTPVSRTQLLKWAKDGSIDILIGTHSLMNKSVVMRHFALAIIDEQHRFGSNQRRMLISKDGYAPHLLSMTATPIPRTLALTIFGDLDLSILDEMPLGRKPIITKFINRGGRPEMYEHLRQELKNGRQGYVICPRIDERDEKTNPISGLKNTGGIRSVNEEAKILAKGELKNYRIGVLHGKMLPKDKEDIMDKFLRHEIDVLVATSVIEVGVNVPNASVIIIEEAERFGAAQLHQLRGRVIRGTHQSYCYLVSDSGSEKSGKRLTTLVETKNGFELAEADMMERGPGEFAGVKQSGISDIAMEALKNIRLVEAAKKEAKILLENDKDLLKYPAIEDRLSSRARAVHFE
jgi:ATP-dependent DNA helicase RecG